ncbi:MAG: AAA-like domain-containing protein [Lachnospiraceae bacterium]
MRRHIFEERWVVTVKAFTTTGICVPKENYMVDIRNRLEQIRAMVDAGQYFTIHRARQYGKTTTLMALAQSLCSHYYVLSLDFQRIGSAGFTTEEKFVKSFCRQLKRKGLKTGMPDSILDEIEEFLTRRDNQAALDELFDTITRWCEISDHPVVMLIDEVDSAVNNQVFLDFLAQLRALYIERKSEPGVKTFQSVILAGVTDVKNLKRKLHPDVEHKFNSPWNIASDFNIDMSLSAEGITGMLSEYEKDYHTGMDTALIAQEIYDFTSGYPFLVSRICQVIDTQLVEAYSAKDAWTRDGVSEAVRRILIEKNTLFDSLMGKVHDRPEMSRTLERILFAGDFVSYNAYNAGIADAEMFGFVRDDNGKIVVSNRMFETLLYNYYLSVDELQESGLFKSGANAKMEFVQDGRLLMDKILEKYVTVFGDLYGNQDERFSEAEGRRRFLLFIRPVINGTGNYYIEPQTRNNERMDLVIDYLGERHVCELKIWRGRSYHEKGEKQLADYLDYYHLNKGYLLTYRFNQNKKPGVTKAAVNGKVLIEALI